ncbi:MAG: cell envelope integrity protein TolA [Candidatus Electrothrix sp. AR4]|nr:cell envelope integrity protein TolA [Candidatus Electrothrix sp. AR4]
MNSLHHDVWEAFLEQREKRTNWKLSFNIAVAFHVVAFWAALVLPDTVKQAGHDKNVVTVNLLSLPASAPMLPTAPLTKKRGTSMRQSEPKPAQEKHDVESIDVESEQEVEVLPAIQTESVIAPEPVVQANPVSLRPLKRKKKLAKDTRLAEAKEREEQAKSAALAKKRLAEEKKRKKEAEAKERLAEQKKRKKEAEAKKRLAEQKRQKKAFEARRLAQQAEDAAAQARIEAERARLELASVAQAVSDINMPLTSDGIGLESGFGVAGGLGTDYPSGSGGGLANSDVIERQYGATLNDRIRSQWQLPEIITTKPNLRAMVALTVRQDGSIKDMRIEQRSGDTVFDQSVIKALRNAEPMPIFPSLINKATLEFDLIFTPNGVR